MQNVREKVISVQIEIKFPSLYFKTSTGILHHLVVFVGLKENINIKQSGDIVYVYVIPEAKWCISRKTIFIKVEKELSIHLVK